MFFLPGQFNLALGRNTKGKDSLLDQAVSLDITVDANGSGDGGDTTLGEFIADESAYLPFLEIEEELASENIRDTLYPILDGLSIPQQEIIFARYWLNMTYQAIGEQYGISKQRVHKIEQSAFERLRRNPQINKLKDSLS